MSLDIIKSQIEKFLISKTPEVMAIRGDWGVGKTYSWKKFLKEAKNENKITLKRYSYVSLFGLNSLESLKYAIFENVINRELIGTEASVETFKENRLALLESLSRKTLNPLKKFLSLGSLTLPLESLSFLSLNETLICVDDLERRGHGLDPKDVLGLISFLKEQKRCKIVLLLNDEKMGSDEYFDHREKVFDIQLKFDPTAEESASIAFEKKNSEFAILKELTQKLEINNIRVLKKIEYFVEQVIPLLKGYEEEVTYGAIHSLTLFTWCYYCSKDGAPTLEFVTNSTYSSYLGLEKDKEENEEESDWRAILRKYNYTSFDNIDRVLAESVQTGFLNKKDFIKEASAKNDEIIGSKGRDSFFASWKAYHNSFNNNEDEVINEIYESLKTNILFISRLDLNGAVNLFRKLSQDQKASEMIDFYMENRSDESQIFNLNEGLFPGDKIDDEIVQKFNSVYEDSVLEENASQVLGRIAGTNSWNPSDVVVLANTSVEEYFQLFKSEAGEHLSSYVKRCLEFGGYGDSNKEYTKIAQNAREALIRIGDENDINKLRVRKFGIEIPEETHRERD